MDLSWQPVTGAAQRRRWRRLRAAWRSHDHSAPRRQMMARAGDWVRDVPHGEVPEEPTTQAAGTEYFSLDVEDVPASGMRPGVLPEPRPQERVLRHTMEHMVDFVCCAPVVQILDSKCPRSCLRTSLCERSFANISWWNSWWMCR